MRKINNELFWIILFLFVIMILSLCLGCGRKECKPYKQYENEKGIFTIDLESGDTLGRILKGELGDSVTLVGNMWEGHKCDTVFIHDTIYTSTHINKVDNLIIQ